MQGVKNICKDMRAAANPLLLEAMIIAKVRENILISPVKGSRQCVPYVSVEYQLHQLHWQVIW